MFGFSKFFLPLFFKSEHVILLIYFFHYRIPPRPYSTNNRYLQISGSNFTGIFTASPVLTKETKWSPKLSWAALHLLALSKEKSAISLATLLPSGGMAAHTHPIHLSNKSLSCRFVWTTKLPSLVMKRGTVSNNWSRAIAKQGWVHKDWYPRLFHADRYLVRHLHLKNQ